MFTKVLKLTKKQMKRIALPQQYDNMAEKYHTFIK